MKKRFKKIPLRIYLLYLVIASLIFTGVTFSSYVSTTSGGDEVRVALFAADTEVTVPVSEVYPGCSFTIPIRVMNYEETLEGTRICEVSQRFSIEAETLLGRIPLTLTWEQGSAPRGDLFLTDGIGGKRHLDYDLIVSWDVSGGYPSHDYADEIEVIRIIARAEQID